MGGVRASLTRREVASFRDAGYLVVEDFLTPSELIAWRGAAQQAVAQRPHRLPTGDVEQPGLEDNPHVFTQRLNLWKTHEGMRTLTLDHRLGALAATLSGAPAIRLYSDQALFKEPYSSATPWRQESPFLAFSEECVLLWVALTDATPSNGCLHVLPGSHHVASERGVPIGANIGGLFDIYPELHSISPEMVPLQAGACVLLTGWLAFAAGANLTHGRQMALQCDFMPDGAVFNGRQNWLTSGELARLRLGAPLDDGELFPLVHCEPSATRV
jgi:phytanoyl-CoA hydroxylase